MFRIFDIIKSSFLEKKSIFAQKITLYETPILFINSVILIKRYGTAKRLRHLCHPSD